MAYLQRLKSQVLVAKSIVSRPKLKCIFQTRQTYCNNRFTQLHIVILRQAAG